MKNLFVALFAVVVGMGMLVADAEAKRLGGGKSLGMQRESVKPTSPTAAPAASPTATATAPAMGAAGAAAAATPKRSWLGPVAGLAAGLGLAALASHFGFGEGLANVMMILLLAMAAFFILRLLFRRKQAAAPTLQYAGVGTGPGTAAQFSATPAAPGSSSAALSTARIPAGFDVEGFVRQAKLNFIRMQAANDAGNLDDLREFTSPEIFAELKLAIAERGAAKQETDVAQIEAAVLEVLDEGHRYVVSVQFRGMLREDGQAAEAFDEIWHLTKPADGSRGWVVTGIQQTH